MDNRFLSVTFSNGSGLLIVFSKLLLSLCQRKIQWQIHQFLLLLDASLASRQIVSIWSCCAYQNDFPSACAGTRFSVRDNSRLQLLSCGSLNDLTCMAYILLLTHTLHQNKKDVRQDERQVFWWLDREREVFHPHHNHYRNRCCHICGHERRLQCCRSIRLQV